MLVPVHRTAPIYFAHVHKAGGSSMCDTARLNGRRCSNENCNAPQSDQRRILSSGTAAAQRELLLLLRNQLRLTFIANEAGLPDDMYWAPEYRYVTLLRAPAARYLSQVRW